MAIYTFFTNLPHILILALASPIHTIQTFRIKNIFSGRMGKSKELENGRLKNPYRFPKVKTNPIPTPKAEGWICFDLREEVWIFSISFF